MSSSRSVVLVTGSYDQEIRFWEAWSGATARIISKTSGEVGQVNRLAISPDKRFLAAAMYKKIKIYDVNSSSNTPLLTFEGHSNNVTALQFQNQGKWLVSGSEDQTIRVWDMRTRSLHRTFDNEAPVNDVCIYPNQGELVSADQNGSVKLWDLNGGKQCILELSPGGEVAIRSVGIASDGTFLIAANNKGKVFVWRINDDDESELPRFQAVTRISAHQTYITRAVISPDVKFLATCSADTTCKIWAITPTLDFKHHRNLVGHQRWVWDCAWSTDSAYLVTASSDHVARLWEVASGQSVREYHGHSKACVCCALADHT
ncbi:WD40 repeat-like protein [Auriculariales sp. MPI-PUGE-AT-0066]|nr:WD40 repeat-like protein [Auriculariales sp. MPI-PUGE-AT-0066]